MEPNQKPSNQKYLKYAKPATVPEAIPVALVAKTIKRSESQVRQAITAHKLNFGILPDGARWVIKDEKYAAYVKLCEELDEKKRQKKATV